MEFESGATTTTTTTTAASRSSKADRRHRTKLKLKLNSRPLCQRDNKLKTTPSKTTTTKQEIVAQTTAGGAQRRAPLKEPQLNALALPTPQTAKRGSGELETVAAQVTAIGRETRKEEGEEGGEEKEEGEEKEIPQRGIYFHRIDHHGKQEEEDMGENCQASRRRQTRRRSRRKGRRRRARHGGDPEWPRGTATRLAPGRRHCCQLRPTTLASSSSSVLCWLGVLAPLIIIIGSLEMSLMLISTQANCQTIELGEGLTLNQNNGNNRHSSSSVADLERQQQQQHEWPLQHLERIKTESRVSAVLGQNVVLNCAVEFPGGQEKPFVVNWLKYPHKLPIYIWYAGYPPHVAQGYESRVTRIGQASLNLTSVRESDKGLYECKIYYLDRRPEDKTNGTWIYLDVQAPPHWIEKPPPISYVQAGDSLHLTCQAQSTPAPKLLWYKNKVPIDSDAGPYRLSSSTGQTFPFHSQQQQKANNNNAPANGQVVVTDKQLAKQLDNGQNIAQLDLFIDNVQAGQTTGDYVCMASNLEGTIEARSQVVLAVPAVITTWPRNQTRLEGERVELLCQAKALPANITYKWLFNNKPLQQLKWFDSRYTQKRDGTLVIHSLHRDDQGEYKCQATNGLSHRSRLIGGGAGDEVGAGGMGEGGGNSRGVTGSPIKTANSNNNNNDNNHQLATTTTSAAAPIYAEAAAYLSVEFPARVTYSPPVQYLPLGMPGQIRCYVQSVPPVEFFTWTLNNQQFDPNTDANIERLQNGSLLIKQVNESYEGQYRCTPFNKHGSAGSSAAMEVRVQEPPQFVSRPEDFYKANLNGQIKIPCDGRGSPKPNVSWRRVIQVPRKAAAHHNQHDLNNNNAPEPGADRGHSNNQRYYENNNNQSNRLKREPRQFRIGSGGGGSDRVNGVNGGVKALTSGESATTRHFHSANQHQTAHLAYDEAADEPDETHHFYATTVATSQHQDQPGDGNSGGGSAPASPMLLDGQTTDNVGSSNNNNNNAIAANQDETNQQQQQSQEQEQQTVIVYSKLPSDRSEYKNSYLHLHNLRKEDHGRYECVIENEVATLVASTMLYIEETTPHAPTDVRVDTKVWSAQVSWTPGYDGGFEQSFVVWYRQVDRPKQHQQSHHSSSSSPSSAAGGEMGANSQQLNDVIDVNWHSQNVQSSDATSLIVQNLSQDTTYEFYVRAKNIIGEGPRSQVIQATTKRAIMGSVTPISPVLGGPETIAASTVAGIGDDLNSSKRPNYEPANNEDDTEPATVTSPTSSIRPYLIIHPEYVSPPISLATSNANNASNQFQTGGSSRTNNNNNQIDGSQHTQFQSTNHQGADTNETGDLPTTMSSNKVIKIYFPSQNNKQHSQQQSNGTDSSVSPPTIVGKRTSIDQSEQSSSNSNNNSNNNSHLPQAQADQSTAPRNVSMMKVAQGWVLSWAPPQRLPNPASSFGDEHAEAIHQSPTGSNNNNGGAMSQQQQADEQVPNTGADTSSSPSSPGHLLQDPMKGSSLPSISKDQRRGQLDTEQQQPFVYSIELKEKNSTVWQAFGSSREPSLLLKDLRAGGDYQFRVIAHTANGLKGAPSAEFRYFIPDNKRKPGLTQAFSATVTSGLLFFIACIVIAVCGVNMCNKRRKKRAEKAAYVMMACPVLESHHDIAALNSNSLLKNSATNAPQDRVPGLSSIGQQRHQNGAPTNEHAHHLTGHSLRLASSLTARNDEHQGSEQNRVPTTNKRLSKDRLKLSINSSGTPHLDRRLVDFLQKVLFGRKSANESTQEANSYNHHHLPSCQQTGAGVCRDAPMLEEREINFSSNEPFPVDVDPIEKFLNNQSNPDNQREQQQRPLDDYWVRQPSDRKWGTLTLAASKLAERRAAANEARREQRASDVTDLSIDRLQQQQQQQHHEPHPKRGSLEFTGNLTLPRSFKTHLGPSSRLKATTTATISSNNNNNNSASTSPPRVPPRIATQKPQLPAPIPPPKDTQLGASNNNQNTQQIDHQFTSAQMHRRSISHIEAKSGSLANHRQSSLATRDGLQLQLQSLTHNWPQTAWTQQDLCDWASMSFGPPVSSFQQQASEQQAAAWPVVPPPVTCSSTQVYKSSATIDAPFNQWASGHHHHQQQQQQQYNSFNYTASTMQMHNPQEQQQLRDQNDRDNSQPMSSSMKRNSLARSTLPMMAPITSSSFNQSILAPPYNPAHDQQAFTIQQRQPLLVCPFYPSVPTVLPPLLSSYGARRELDIGQLKQVTAATSTGNHLEYNGQAAVDHHHTFNDNDDPLTENACLGSYKRKRRLPHIEAQFTMTKLPGPELPPKDVDDHSRIVSQSQRRQASRQPFHTRTNSSIFGQQQDCSSTTTTRFRSLSESEQHPHNMQSYEPETGGLFVRDATCVETFAGPKSYTTTTGGRGGDNGGLTVVAHRSPPPPPGMPQSGQRTEQRLLRESTSLELASLGRGGVDKSNVIDANEKIATYLRSHQHQVSLPVSSNSNTTTNPSGGPQLRPPNSITLSSNLSSPSSSTSSNDSPVELDQVDEITFQPYYNMPSLKYTISLPVRQTQNGRLVLEPSSNLRPKRRAGGSGGSYRRSSRSSTLASFSELQHTARHLGSNSSCPVEPPADSEHRDADSRPQPPTPPPLPPQPPSLPARISINTTASFTVNERQRDNIQTDNSRMTMIQRNSNVTLEANANNNTSSGSSNGANDKGFQLKNATTAAYAEIYSSVHEEELEQGQASVSVSPTNRETNCRGSSFGKSEAPPVPPHRTQQSGLLAGKLDETQAATRVPPPPQFGCHRQKKAIHQVSSSETNKTDEALELEGAPHVLEERAANYGRGRRESVTTTTTGAGACAPTSSAISPVDSSAASNSSTTSSSSCTSSASVPASSSSSEPTTLSGGRNSGSSGGPISHHARRHGFDEERQPDQSVDESYEFDHASSSCSSSLRASERQNRRRRRKRQSGAPQAEPQPDEETITGATVKEHREKRANSGADDDQSQASLSIKLLANNESKRVVEDVVVVYGRVDKSKKRHRVPLGGDKSLLEQPKQQQQQPTTNFVGVVERARFYDCTRQMEKTLVLAAGNRHPSALSPPLRLMAHTGMQRNTASSSSPAHDDDDRITERRRNEEETRVCSMNTTSDNIIANSTHATNTSTNTTTTATSMNQRSASPGVPNHAHHHYDTVYDAMLTSQRQDGRP